MIKTRFSPSPTGMLHLGSARTALFSALYARKCSGNFILRIEDTDASRSEDQYTTDLQNDLRWQGIEWQEGPVVGGDNGPYWQSQRADIYARYYDILEEKKLAFPCFCSEQELAVNRKLQQSRGLPPRYAGTCRNLTPKQIAEKIASGKQSALRFHVPTKKNIDFVDTVKGPQHFNSDDIGDFIIRRTDGTSSFMFCNAIDDALMQVTDVLRGEDHVSNTPRQLMILEALGLPLPRYGHLSLITGDDGAPLSKRHGSSSLQDLREEGYLPLAVLNYLARLGHAYDEPKLLSFDELASRFHLEKLSRSPARFDKNQLMHWQKEAVMALTHDEVWNWFGDDIKKLIPDNSRDLFVDTVRPNLSFSSEAKPWVEILFENHLAYSDDSKDILQKAGEGFFSALKTLTEQHGTDLKPILDSLKNQLNISGKNLFMPLRVALTAQQHGPELQLIANLLGKEKMLQRIEQPLQMVRNG